VDTYYDTADLRLTRAGITLRHRSGDRGPAWKAKLPAGTEGLAPVDREIRFAGPAGHVPGAATDLVLAATRAGHLVEVARATTVRSPVQIRDRGGGPLAEVVEDDVTMSVSRRPAAHFREVGVELAAEARARLRRAVVARLIDAGCTAQPPAPTLVRALGEPASQPPDVVVPALPADTTINDVLRHAIARSVDQILRHDPGVRLGNDPEDVHQLRVGTRRLRSDLRTFADVLDRGQFAAIRSELAWLSTLVGAVRDTDVLTARLRTTGQTLPDLDTPAVAMLLTRLDAQADAARTAMLQALRSPRYLRLLDGLVALAACPPLTSGTGPADHGAARVAIKGARRSWRHVAGAVATLPPHPPDAALHQIRILAKRCRYAAEAVTTLCGPPADGFAAAIASVQAVLGDHQDTVVAEAWLREAATAQPGAGLVAGQLVTVERAKRAELRSRWPTIWRAASDRRLRRWM
jgi:CHAD domain-containing protein